MGGQRVSPWSDQSDFIYTRLPLVSCYRPCKPEETICPVQEHQRPGHPRGLRVLGLPQVQDRAAGQRGQPQSDARPVLGKDGRLRHAARHRPSGAEL